MTQKELVEKLHIIQSRLVVIQQALDIIEIERNPMAVDPIVANLVSQFDEATNAVAARIERIKAANPQLSPESQAAIQSEIDKLKSLGQDPANPIPPEVVNG